MAKFAAKDSNKNITLSPHGTGKVVVGTGAADATVQSDGNHNLVLQTGNSTTGSISITDGADGSIDITPNGTGLVEIGNDIAFKNITGASAQTNKILIGHSGQSNDKISFANSATPDDLILSIDDQRNVTIESAATFDTSAGSLTTSTAQKTAIVDGGKGNLTKSDVGLSNVTNDAQVPASGGTFSGNVAVNGDLTVDTNTLTVDSSGNQVGIGTATPANALHVEKAGSTVATFRTSNSNSSGGIELGGKDSGGTLQPIYLQSNASAELLFLQGSGATERMRIDSSGNVGIGTDDPSTPIEVVNTSFTSSVTGGKLRHGTTFQIQDSGSNLAQIVAYSEIDKAVQFGVQRNKTSGSYNDAWTMGMSENSKDWQLTKDTLGTALTVDTSGNLKFNSGFGSAGTAYGVRAWANVNATSTSGNCTINGSAGFSTIGVSSGKYTFNFSPTMPNDDYSVNLTMQRQSGDGSSNGTIVLEKGTSLSTSLFKVFAFDSAGGTINPNIICAQVVR